MDPPHNILPSLSLAILVVILIDGRKRRTCQELLPNLLAKETVWKVAEGSLGRTVG